MPTTTGACGGTAIATQIEQAFQRILGISPGVATSAQFFDAVNMNFVIEERDGSSFVRPAGGAPGQPRVPLAALPHSQRRLAEAVSQAFADARRIMEQLRPLDCCVKPAELHPLISEVHVAMGTIIEQLGAGPVVQAAAIGTKFQRLDGTIAQLESAIRGDSLGPNDPKAYRITVDFAELRAFLKCAKGRWVEWNSAKKFDRGRHIARIHSRLEAIVCATDDASLALAKSPCAIEVPNKDVRLDHLLQHIHAFSQTEAPRLLSSLGTASVPSIIFDLRKQKDDVAAYTPDTLPAGKEVAAIGPRIDAVITSLEDPLIKLDREVATTKTKFETAANSSLVTAQLTLLADLLTIKPLLSAGDASFQESLLAAARRYERRLPTAVTDAGVKAWAAVGDALENAVLAFT